MLRQKGHLIRPLERVDDMIKRCPAVGTPRWGRLPAATFPRPLFLATALSKPLLAQLSWPCWGGGHSPQGGLLLCSRQYVVGSSR